MSEPQNALVKSEQSQENVVEVKQDPTFWLSKDEKAALELFKANGDRPLSTTTTIKLYNLYLENGNLEEIAEINPEFEYGAIVNAAVEGDWYNRKKAYLDQLYDRAKDSAMQTVSQGAVFISKVLAVAHKKQGQQLSKFLQTEDPKYLKDAIEITSLQGYRNAVEILMRLTGQDQVKKVQVSGNVVHEEKKPEPKPEEPSPVAIATDVTQLVTIRKKAKDAG